MKKISGFTLTLSEISHEFSVMKKKKKKKKQKKKNKMGMGKVNRQGLIT
jgi:hypothetical protein